MLWTPAVNSDERRRVCGKMRGLHSILPVMDTVFARGFAAHRDGRLTEAERDYQAALAAEPRHVDALHLLGVLRHQQGQHAEAAELVRRAVDLRPTDAGLQLNLGNALKALGRIDDAIERFRNALTLQPGFRLRNTTSATRTRRRAVTKTPPTRSKKPLRLQPNDAPTWNNFGNALSALRRFHDAAKAFRRALATASAACRRAQQSRHGAQCARRPRRRDRAVPCRHRRRAELRRRAFQSRQPARRGRPAGRSRRGRWKRRSACSRNSRRRISGSGTRSRRSAATKEALPQFERAVGLDPKYGVAWLGLGNAHLALGNHQAAIRAFDQALRLAPDEPAAHLNRALALLALGDYARGLPAYEWRLDTPGSTPAPPLPRWNGEPMPGRTLLVRARTGFRRYAAVHALRAASPRSSPGGSCCKCSRRCCRCWRPRRRRRAIELTSSGRLRATKADAFMPAAEPAARARHDDARRDSRAHAVSR